MLELPHAMVGAAIAIAIPNPIISLPLALASHFITDYIPHWNPHTQKDGSFSKNSLIFITGDCLLALVAGSFIALRSPQPLIVLLACFLAVLPDVVEIPHFFFHSKIEFIEKLLAFQRRHQFNISKTAGLLTQLVVILVCFYFIRSA